MNSTFLVIVGVVLCCLQIYTWYQFSKFREYASTLITYLLAGTGLSFNNLEERIAKLEQNQKTTNNKEEKTHEE